jgi:hypothetical protein
MTQPCSYIVKQHCKKFIMKGNFKWHVKYVHSNFFLKLATLISDTEGTCVSCLK